MLCFVGGFRIEEVFKSSEEKGLWDDCGIYIEIFRERGTEM